MNFLPSLLFASVGLLTCGEARDIISDVRSEYGNTADTEIVQTVQDATEPGCDWDAHVDWRNGVLSTLSRGKPMAQVTYRGVKYDTDSRKAAAPAKSDMIYRGVKHSKAVAA